MWTIIAAMQAMMIPLPATVDADVACAAAIAIELKQAPVAYRPAASIMLAYLIGRLERDAPGRNIGEEIDGARLVQRKEPLTAAARERCFKDAGRVTDMLMAVVPPRGR